MKTCPEQIDSNDRGHGHVGGVQNHGMDNHQHGKPRKGVAASPAKARAITGSHPVFSTREGHVPHPKMRG
jgi:hypothetical protein